jgi:hypothetical protein
VENDAARAAAEAGQPVTDAVAGEPKFSAVVIPAEEGDLDQGSADDDEDSDIARLPRPRPVAPGEEAEAEPNTETASAELITQPLDLVAGAAAGLAAEPRPLLMAAADTGDPPEPPASAIEAVQTTPEADQAPSASPARELFASGACGTADDVADADGDFERNAELLAGPGFCVAQTKFKERGKPWTIQTVATGRPGPVWAVLHDDEDMSFDNAARALTTYGGTLITLDTGGKRLVEGIDPNRNFSADGIGCAKLGDDETPRFTAMFRDLFDPAQPVIALHNNERESRSGHASMATVGKSMRAFPAPDQDGPLAGEDTLVLLAATNEDDPAIDATAKALNAAGVNTLVERVREGKGDCSLSNYVLLSGHPSYVNVTVDKDESEKQRKIIDAVMDSRAPTAVATQ